MKISIVTCSNAVNYGARLQCYALSQWLREQGHEVEVVDYRPSYMDAQPTLLYWPGTSVKEWAKLFLQVRTRINERTRVNEFRKFSSKWIPLTRMVYRSSYDLRRYPPQADLYIAGSDQIWNPTLRNGYDPIFFLDFGDKGVKRISYAASFGVDSIDERAVNFMKGYLKGLDAISVRERSGVAIVRRIHHGGTEEMRKTTDEPDLTNSFFQSGKSVKSVVDTLAVQVCDPAFLLTAEQWEEVIAEPQTIQTIKNHQSDSQLKTKDQRLKTNFILIYDQMGSREITEVAQRVARERGLEIWSIGVRKLRYAKRNFLVEGPEVWLWLVRHASVVVSNSFHACVFSIIFHREFLLVKRGDGLNSRMTEFLGEMGMSERIVEAGGEMPGGIDWQAVHGRLDPYIAHSKAWLTQEIVIHHGDTEDTEK